MEKRDALCVNCGSLFVVWDVTEKKIRCPNCGHKSENPYYVELKKIPPDKVPIKMEQK